MVSAAHVLGARAAAVNRDSAGVQDPSLLLIQAVARAVVIVIVTDGDIIMLSAAGSGVLVRVAQVGGQMRPAGEARDEIDCRMVNHGQRKRAIRWVW